jgi:hypothetical protein
LTCFYAIYEFSSANFSVFGDVVRFVCVILVDLA